MNPIIRNRYDLMKDQLRNYYLINTDQIVDSVKNELCDRTEDPTSLLETIFKHVFKGASHYLDFIALDSYHPFFNEEPHNKQIRGICQLLYLTLQNNCILTAFIHQIAPKESTIEISGKNEPSIKQSIMGIIKPKGEQNRLIGTARSAFFYNRKEIFENYFDQDIYTIKILKSLNIAENTGRLPLTTLTYLSPVANFLFTENVCNNFIYPNNDSSKILENYNMLWNQYLIQLENYASRIDKLIFESEMNTLYGFSYFNSIFKYIETMHSSALSEKKGLKDLEGQQFVNIILRASNLPLFFNKELFLKFACCAFLLSPKTDYSYFEQSAKYGMFRIEPSDAKYQQALVALDLFHKFFQALNSVSLPVLFSLWEVTVNDLDIGDPSALTDIYESYLSENYDSINYSYFNITDDQITKWGHLKFTMHSHLDNKLLAKYIHKNPCTYDPTTDHNGTTIKSIFPTKHSKYASDVTGQLIQSYCNIDSLKESRFPFFFLRDSELDFYSPLSELISSTLLDPGNNSTGIAKSTFQTNHKNILYEYLSSRE